MPVRNYTYYDFTLSLCPECLKRIDAKIVFENDNVYMLKRCPEHGNSKVLIADDIPYSRKIFETTTNPLKLLINSIQKQIMAARMIVAYALIMSNIHV